MARSGWKIAQGWRVVLPRRFRWLSGLTPSRGLAAVTLLAGLIWLGAHAADRVAVVQAAFPLESGRRAVEGLGAPVSILRDARGIPHIEVAVDLEAWCGLGFVHAQDRLSQMLWLRRVARGRTAEIVGESGLPADRLARTLGIGRLADRQIGAVAPAALEILTAYAAGVNDQIEGVRSGRLAGPVTLKGEISTIEDWSPADSLALVKLIAWSSSNGLQTGLVLDELIRVLGGRLAAPFRPGGEQGAVGRSGGPTLGVPVPRARPFEDFSEAASGPSLGGSVRVGGGTAWVLGGRYTKNGLPLVLADFQLPATAPALVYEAHLRGPELGVAGATIPGIPIFWAGRNSTLAWAAVFAGAVTVDLYMETVRETTSRYHDGSRWMPLEIRREVIRVRGVAGIREEELEIRSTRHGPLVNSLLLSGADSELARTASGIPPSPLAVAWTGAVAGDDFSGLLGLAGATGSDQLRASLAEHHSPVVAVVYSDSEGDAGIQLAGWLPGRALPSGLVPVPARMKIYDWRERIPYSDLPAVRLDASASADQQGGRSWAVFSDGKIGGGLKDAGIEWLWRPGERQSRLDQRLVELTGAGGAPSPSSGEQRLDLDEAAALQVDVGLRDADEVVPALLRLARLGAPLTEDAQEIASLLSRWDGNLSADSPGAAAYSILNRHLFPALFEESFGASLLGRYLALPGVRPSMVVGRVLLAADRDPGASGWAERDRVVKALRASLRRTWITLVRRLGPNRREWSWGRLQVLAFQPVPAGADAFSGGQRLEGFGVGGDRNTLATAQSVGLDFDVESASLYRLAVDLAKPDGLRTALAPGQSEHPAHPHRDDGIPAWWRGGAGPLPIDRLQIEEESAPPLLLEPSR